MDCNVAVVLHLPVATLTHSRRKMTSCECYHASRKLFPLFYYPRYNLFSVISHLVLCLPVELLSGRAVVKPLANDEFKSQSRLDNDNGLLLAMTI